MNSSPLLSDGKTRLASVGKEHIPHWKGKGKTLFITYVTFDGISAICVCNSDKPRGKGTPGYGDSIF